MDVITGVFVSVVAILSLAYVLITFKGRMKPDKEIPGPKGLPFFGSLSIDSERMHLTFYKMAEEYGDMFQLTCLGQKVIVLNNVDLIRKAFTSDAYSLYFSNRPETFVGKYVLRDCEDVALLTEYNKKAILLRKMVHKCLQLFTNGQRTFEDRVTEEITRLLQKVDSLNGDDLDVKQLLRHSFGNLTSILLSGKEPKPEDSETLWKYNDQMITLLETTLNLFLNMFPFVRFVPGKTGDIIRSTITTQEQLIARYMDNAFPTTKEDSVVEESGMISALQEFQAEENRKAECEIISDGNVKGILMDLIIGGMTSTTNAISAAILLLLNHPMSMKRVQAEIDEIVGRARAPRLNDKNDMPYMMACIYETFRYTSLGPLGLPHRVKADIMFEGYQFSKNDVVYINLWYTNRDEKVWKKPWQFEPARFLSDSGKLLPPSHKCRQNLIPFSVGKRSCPGGEYSLGRMFLYLTSIFQRFDLQAPSQGQLAGYDPRDYKPGLFLEPNDFTCKAVRME